MDESRVRFTVGRQAVHVYDTVYSSRSTCEQHLSIHEEQLGTVQTHSFFARTSFEHRLKCRDLTMFSCTGIPPAEGLWTSSYGKSRYRSVEMKCKSMGVGARVATLRFFLHTGYSCFQVRTSALMMLQGSHLNCPCQI